MKKIIVIGAGILGASSAYHLAKKGAEVIIIDRQDEGQATDAAAGIIGPWLAQRRNKAWYNLAKAGARYYPEVIAELKKDGESETGYAKVGLIGLHTDDKKLLAAKERVLKRKEDAPEIGEVNILTKEETNAMFPLLADCYRSIYIGGAARVDGSAVRNALIRSAEKHGAKMIKADARLLHENKKIVGVKAANEILMADTVIAAAGAWINHLLEPLQIRFGAYPQKAQIIHLEASHLEMDESPVIMPPNNQYILPFHNRIIIGATHETAAGFDHRVTAGGVHEILMKALEVAPSLADLSIKEIKVGYRPFTPGSLPIIGELPGFDGLLIANGLGASGLTIAPYIGRELAKLALGEKTEIHLEDYQISSAIIG